MNVLPKQGKRLLPLLMRYGEMLSPHLLQRQTFDGRAATGIEGPPAAAGTRPGEATDGYNSS
jgi:hypothetical protein